MNILLTKKLSQENIDLIKSWEWNFEIIETLKITLIDVKKIPQSKVWVVSSRNSFEAIEKFIHQLPQFVFCIGGWVKNEIEKLNNSRPTTRSGQATHVKSFENIKSLAADLAKQNFENIIYFCGEEHRQELELGLKKSTTKILKVITHQSEMIYPVIDKAYDAVFVFSSRSVESLLKDNSFDKQTVFACIGNTTLEYVKNRNIANTFVSSYPDSKVLLEEFHQHASTI